MANNTFVTLAVILVALASTVKAYDPAVATLDGGTVTTFILNDGTFGFDPTFSRVGGTGMYYPGNSFLWVLSGGGIWVGGFREGQWRVSASGLESDFVPGPFPFDGMPFDTLYPIYKINRGDGISNEDYRNWPMANGAPATATGEPLIKGAQSLYTVFNDADTAGHVLEGFTGTLPLGVEVHAYFYTCDNLFQVVDTTLAQVLFVDYQITNITDSPIDSCMATIYTDPDIGFSNDDRVGSLDSLQAVYAFNDSNVDTYYGKSPPVVAITMLKNRAISGNFYWRCRSTSPVPCMVVDTVTEVANLMKGFKASGAPYFDPTTSLMTRFPYGGDPVDSTGWLVPSSEDYRMMLSTAPTELDAGESITLTAAITVVRGEDVDDSIVKTRKLLAELRELFEPAAERPEFSAATGEAVKILGRAPSVNDWGGRFLGGGLDRAEYYLNTPLNSNIVFPDVELNFAKTDQYDALRYIRKDGEFQFADQITVPFSAKKVTGGQELRVAVLDSAGNGSYLDVNGKLAPLILVDAGSTGATPADRSALRQIDGVLLYAVDLNETADYLAGTRLQIFGDMVSAGFMPVVDSSDFTMAFPAADGFGERSLTVKNTTDFWQDISIRSDNAAAVSVIPNHVQLAPGKSAQLFLRASGFAAKPANASILFESTSLVVDSLMISVDLTAPNAQVTGDADDDGALTLNDIIDMIAILYKNAPIQVPLNQLDADCDGDFGLADAVLFINYLYRGAEIPCHSTL